MDSSDLFVIHNVNLAAQLPILETRLKKNAASFLYSGLNGHLQVDHTHFGLTSASAVSLYRGKHVFSTLVYSANKVSVLADSFVYPVSSIFSKWTASIVLSTVTDIHVSEVGLSTSSSVDSSSTLYYAIDSSYLSSDTVFSSDSFTVYQGTNAQPSKNKLSRALSNSWYVPSTSSFEFRGFFINLLGYLQLTRKCTTKIGLSLSNSDILLNLFIRLGQVHPFYKNKHLLSADLFYSYLLDFVVVHLEDSSFSSLSESSFSKQLNRTALVSTVDAVSSPLVISSYVKYSNTLSSVAALRSTSTF
jgi:hypothetical protein